MDQSVRPSVRKALATIHCASCHLAAICWPAELPAEAIDRIDSLIVRKPPLPAGSQLHARGEPVEVLGIVRSGAVKTVARLPSGEEHITGLCLPGDVIGIDSIGAPTFVSDAISLDTTMVCGIAYAALLDLAADFESVQRHLLRTLSSRIREDHEFMAGLTHLTAEQKLAAFLLQLSRRLHQRGQSARRLRLPLSRADLANYLGLAPETISRLLARLQQQGFIAAERREVTIVDTGRLMAALAEDSEE